MIDNWSIYEVEKKDYDSYFFRLPKDDIEMIQNESKIIYTDKVTNQEICAKEIYERNGVTYYKYYIFEFLDDNRLGPYKGYKTIQVSSEEFEKLLKAYAEKIKNKND